MPEAVAVVDAGHRIAWVNGAMESYLGLARETILGETCHALLHNTPEPVPGCPFRRVMESRRRETMELEIPERKMWMKVTVDPLIDGDGRIAGAVHYLSDVTPQREEKRRAVLQSEQLVSLLDHLPGVVYRGLRNWAVAFVGADVRRVTGYTAEEFLSGAVKWNEFIHPEDLDRVKFAFREAVRVKRRVVRVEYRARHKDGSIRWLADRRQIIYDAAGEFVCVDGLLLDITDRKRFDETLRQANSRFQALIDASPLAIASLTPEGIVTMWNTAAERMTGWSEEETLGRSLPIVPGEKKEEFRALLARGRKGEPLSGVEVRRRRKDGTPIDISIWTTPMRDPGGRVTGIMSMWADVTERKSMEEALRSSEEQLRQSQKIEAVGRLAGGVAHDFNNLLTAIRGYSDLLLHRLDAASPMRRDVEEIRKAGERATSLTRQLLAFSRKQVMQPKVIDLNAVVAGMDKMLRRLIGEDVDLVTVLKPSLWAVKADPGQVEQVVMNLVVNARDAMPMGGKLTVETADVMLDDGYVRRHAVVRPGPYVRVAISDTGTGMDDGTKSRLFEPFFTTKEKGKGTGLGLSTVYGIVKQSGGYVWAYSELGKGTVFKVYFPRFEGDAAAAEKEGAPARPPDGRETVLVVEDENMVRSLVRDILEGNGYKVLAATDGVEAISIGRDRKEPIHLVLTDVVMPKMGGREAAEALAACLPGVKVLYMSGYTDEAIVHHGVLEPGIPFLEKPFTPDGLLRKVRQVLDEGGERRRPPG